MRLLKLSFIGRPPTSTTAIQFGDSAPGLYVSEKDALALNFIIKDVLNHQILTREDTDFLYRLHKIIDRDVFL